MINYSYNLIAQLNNFYPTIFAGNNAQINGLESWSTSSTVTNTLSYNKMIIKKFNLIVLNNKNSLCENLTSGYELKIGIEIIW